MSHIRLLILCMMFEFLPMIASAEPVAAQSGWLESMRLGGYVVVLRHGLTGSDPSKDAMSNPAKSADAKSADAKSTDAKSTDAMSGPAKASGPTAERQLSEQGRAQAALKECPQTHPLAAAKGSDAGLRKDADARRALAERMLEKASKALAAHQALVKPRPSPTDLLRPVEEKAPASHHSAFDSRRSMAGVGVG